MKADRCPTCGRAHTRSSEQNRMYWSLLNEMADKLKPSGKDYSADTWHIYCKQRFLGQDDVRLPNGKIITRPRSTTSLDKAEMSDYLMRVEQFAAQLGVFNDG